jgi:hypothetical protein
MKAPSKLNYSIALPASMRSVRVSLSTTSSRVVTAAVVTAGSSGFLEFL